MPDITTTVANAIHIPKFTGDLYFVDASMADDALDGTTPEKAKKTIGAAIALLSAGDRITIKAGTYTEVGLDLNVASCELWFELGSILAPASGTVLTISGNYCRVTCEGGALRVNNSAAATTGVLVTGNWVYLNEIRVHCASTGLIGFDIQGDGCDLRRCRVSDPLTAAYKIQGDKNKLEDCCTGGTPADTSIGYWMTNSCDKFRLTRCGSQGHATAPFQVDSGCTNGVIWDFTSGGGDGKWTDADSTTVISDLTYPETVYKEITLDGSTNYNLFLLTGAVEIQEIFGHVTTQLVGVNTDVYLQLYSATDDSSITKTTDTDLGTAVVGSVIMKTEDPGKKITFFDGAGVGVDKGVDPKKKAVVLNAHNDESTYIRYVVTAGDTGGVLHFHVVWRPLTDDGFVTPV